ncbi:MAG: CvpA family protein [Candidatus Omnitrophica bacterium]|nr:CvpA family protein [Candidatus Omnitrophota bacterium]
MTDKIMLVVISICFLIGWQKGFFKAILGPISLIIGSLISIAYYAKTKNMLYSALIGLIAPLVIQMVLSIIFNPSRHNQEKKPNLAISFLSRFSGGIVSVAWSGTLAVFVLVLITLVPLQNNLFTSMQKDITSSKTYRFLNFLSGHKLKKNAVNFEQLENLLKQDNARGNIQKSEAYKNLMDDPAIKNIVSDTQTMDSIQKQDIKSLLGNPKITALMNDPNLIKKMMDFQKEIIEKSSEK